MNSRSILERKLGEALKEAVEADPTLKPVAGKLRALLESYASESGVSESRLLILDLCNDRGEVRRELAQFLMTEYPLADVSRPSYLSNLRRIAKVLISRGEESKSAALHSVFADEIPEEWGPMLPFIPREGVERLGGNLKMEAVRLRTPYSRNGQYFLVACLRVWSDHNLSSLEDLFREYSGRLRRAINAVARERAGSVEPLIDHVRRQLGIPPLRGVRRAPVPCEQMLEPFRTEVETYRRMALSLGDAKSEEERLAERAFIRAAAEYGLTPQKATAASVRTGLYMLSLLYTFLRPVIESEGRTSFSVRDLLVKDHEGCDTGGAKARQPHNILMDLYRAKHVERADWSKEAGFDSASFASAITAVRAVGIYNGYFEYIKGFCAAYRSVVFDEGTTNRRKEVKKSIYPLDYVDGEIARLRAQVSKVLRSRSFVRGRARRMIDADRNLNLCLFYVVLVVLRYFGYRQQCIRNCSAGRNIVFGRDGSITLSWAKGEVKNKKPITVTLTAERNDGAWEPVVHALTLYEKKVRPYVLRLSDEQPGGAEALEGQYFVQFNVSDRLVRFDAQDDREFYRWFMSQAKRFLVLPDEAYETGVFPNPHFFRGLCMDWLHAIGMSDEDIAKLTGDTVGVINEKYRNKNAPEDGTPVLARTDRRLKEERRDRTDPDARLRELEEAHRAELLRRDEIEAGMRAEMSRLVGLVEGMLAERSGAHALTAAMQASQQEQLEISRRMLEKLDGR